MSIKPQNCLYRRIWLRQQEPIPVPRAGGEEISYCSIKQYSKVFAKVSGLYGLEWGTTIMPADYPELEPLIKEIT